LTFFYKKGKQTTPFYYPLSISLRIPTNQKRGHAQQDEYKRKEEKLAADLE
jgi:hypothetical protein